MMFSSAYSARSDKSDVRVPAPAINGKAIGTILADVGVSSRKSERPKTISNARKKITKEPATAKLFTSTPSNRRILFPKNRKATMITNATTLAFSDCM